MKRLILFVIFFALATSAQAADLRVTVLKVVDGDTIRVQLAGCDCIPEILREHLVRLRGVDAPELHDPRPELRVLAGTATLWVATRVHVGDQLVLVDVERDKYGRLLASIVVDGQDLSQGLIAAGLAKKYDGGRRSW